MSSCFIHHLGRGALLRLRLASLAARAEAAEAICGYTTTAKRCMQTPDRSSICSERKWSLWGKLRNRRKGQDLARGRSSQARNRASCCASCKTHTHQPTQSAVHLMRNPRITKGTGPCRRSNRYQAITRYRLHRSSIQGTSTLFPFLLRTAARSFVRQTMDTSRRSSVGDGAASLGIGWTIAGRPRRKGLGLVIGPFERPRVASAANLCAYQVLPGPHDVSEVVRGYLSGRRSTHYGSLSNASAAKARSIGLHDAGPRNEIASSPAGITADPRGAPA